MKKIVFPVILFAFLTTHAQQAYQSERLTRKWETAPELKVPESVCYDHDRQVIYVSNVTGSPTDKDNTGFISQLSPDGKILNLKWVTGLNAPKGMGISGDYLYVSDITQVVKIDIAAGKVVESVDIAGSLFLNDIAADKTGTVYVSDMTGDAIYAIRKGRNELLVKSDRIKGVNGLYLSGESLLAGLQDRIVSINLRTREVKDLVLNTGAIDGLVPDGNGNYIISDWLGNIHLVGAGKERIRLLDTTPVNVNAADIDYVIPEKLLLVPTFSDNRVVAYELK